MKLDELTRAAHPEKLSAFLAKQPKGGHHHGGEGVESTREADHKGHHIIIRTTYRIEVDGRVLDLPLGVDNDGHVHCHSLPNYQFTSAIGMVKQLIDSFPGDFSKKRKRPSPTAPPMPHHGGMHMSKRSGTTRRKGR
jgi:hypothetical protein